MAAAVAKQLLQRRLEAFERRRADAADTDASVRAASETRHEARLFEQLVCAGPDTALPQFYFKVSERCFKT
jgi:hypothetical protein